MKKSELKELIRLITEQVLKEYSTMSSLSGVDPTDPAAQSTDVSTTTGQEKAPSQQQIDIANRKKAAELQNTLKKTADAQKSAKKEADLYKQKAGEYEKYKKKDFKNKVDTIKNQIAIMK